MTRTIFCSNIYWHSIKTSANKKEERLFIPLKPGEKVPVSGQYGVIGSRGGILNEVTVVKGESMPLTQKAGQTYVLNDPTNNKSGKIKK